MRFDELLVDGGYTVEWRRLQFDAVQAFIEAQREFLTLHNRIVEVIKSDRELYNRMRLESLELALACDVLRELIRDIERCLTAVEHSN